MIEVKENISLKALNTFGLDVKARYLASLHQADDLMPLLNRFRHVPVLFLGEGSNVLFLEDFEGLVILNRLEGEIEILDQQEESIHIAVPGGMHWHDVVNHTVERGWQGIETLALIPGKAGTAPFQNIGAFGTELADVLTACHVIDTETGQNMRLTKDQCGFGYRDSLFKRRPGRYFIHRLELRLFPGRAPQVRYRALENYLNDQGITRPDIKDVFRAVVEIRRAKLPDPAVTGNAGSFFKNPVVGHEHYDRLAQAYPGLPAYPAGNDRIKIPAGWLIDRAGWKGFREGDAGVHPKQALVLVNYGNATGFQIYKLAQRIMADVFDRYGISLEPEVRIIRNAAKQNR